MSAEYVETGFIERTETPAEKRGFGKAVYVTERLVSYLVQKERGYAGEHDNLSDCVNVAGYRPVYEIVRIGITRINVAPYVIDANDMLSDMKAHDSLPNCEASRSR